MIGAGILQLVLLLPPVKNHTKSQQQHQQQPQQHPGGVADDCCCQGLGRVYHSDYLDRKQNRVTDRWTLTTEANSNVQAAEMRVVRHYNKRVDKKRRNEKRCNKRENSGCITDGGSGIIQIDIGLILQ